MPSSLSSGDTAGNTVELDSEKPGDQETGEPGDKDLGASAGSAGGRPGVLAGKASSLKRHVKAPSQGNF